MPDLQVYRACLDVGAVASGAEPFVATARFFDYKALRAPSTFTFDVYGRDPGSLTTRADGSVSIDPDGLSGPQSSFVLTSGDNTADFVSRALRVNGLIRWEYRSGSVGYLVWQRTRDGQAVLTDPSIEGGRGGLRNVPAKDVVLLKATFALGH